MRTPSGPPHLVGFLASALRAPAPKPTKCDTIPKPYLFFGKVVHINGHRRKEWN